MYYNVKTAELYFFYVKHFARTHSTLQRIGERTNSPVLGFSGPVLSVLANLSTPLSLTLASQFPTTTNLRAEAMPAEGGLSPNGRVRLASPPRRKFVGRK